MDDVLPPLSPSELKRDLEDKPYPDPDIIRRIKEKHELKVQQDEQLKELSSLTVLSETVQPAVQKCRLMSQIADLEFNLAKLHRLGAVHPGDPVERSITARIQALKNQPLLKQHYAQTALKEVSSKPDDRGDKVGKQEGDGTSKEEKENQPVGANDPNFGAGMRMPPWFIKEWDEASDRNNMYGDLSDGIKYLCSTILTTVVTSHALREVLDPENGPANEEEISSEDLVDRWNTINRMHRLFQQHAKAHSAKVQAALKARAEEVREEIDAQFRFVQPVENKFFDILTDGNVGKDADFVDYEGTLVDEEKVVDGLNTEERVIELQIEERDEEAIKQENKEHLLKLHHLPRPKYGEFPGYFRFFNHLKTDLTPPEDVEVFVTPDMTKMVKMKRTVHSYYTMTPGFMKNMEYLPHEFFRTETYEQAKLKAMLEKAKKEEERAIGISVGKKLYTQILEFLSTPRKMGLHARSSDTLDSDCPKILTHMCRTLAHTLVRKLRAAEKEYDEWIDIGELFNMIQEESKDAGLGRPSFLVTIKILEFFVKELVKLGTKLYMDRSIRRGISEPKKLFLPPPLFDDWD